MSETSENTELLAGLKAIIASANSVAQPHAAQQPQQAGGFGLPAQQPMMAQQPMQPMMAQPGMMQTGMMAAGPGGAMPQPVGILVPIKIPMPDGSSMRMYVQFGPEAAQNIQQTAMVALQMFGNYLDTWAPRQSGGGFGGGFGGNGGGNWGGRRSYGRY